MQLPYDGNGKTDRDRECHFDEGSRDLRMLQRHHHNAHRETGEDRRIGGRMIVENPATRPNISHAAIRIQLDDRVT